MAKTSLCVCVTGDITTVQPRNLCHKCSLLPSFCRDCSLGMRPPHRILERETGGGQGQWGCFLGTPSWQSIYIYIHIRIYIYIRTYIYLVYKWYIFANWMVIFITYHLLQELETTIDFRTGRNLETMIRTWVLSLKCFQIWWFNGWKYAIMWISILCTRCMYRSEGNIHPGLVCFSKDTK